MKELRAAPQQMNHEATEIKTASNRLKALSVIINTEADKAGLTNDSYRKVRKKLQALSQNLKTEGEKMMSMSAALNNAVTLYMECEARIADQGSAVEYADSLKTSQDAGFADAGQAQRPKEGNEGIWEVIIGLLNDVKENEDILSVFKTFFKVNKSWGNDEEAGVFEKVISYAQAFADFFTGDKKGLTGASELCSLGDASIGVWKGLYDYYCSMYKDLEKGFFGKAAQRRVQMLGLTGSILGLISSITEARVGLNEKSWQNKTADYVDCCKDGVPVISSIYKLKHIGDVKSLAKDKWGPWSALNIYEAIGDAVVRAVSQGFRSYEKYAADGVWDMGDTGAMGIDISMAGLYGLSHKLTLGFDDVIFRAIDMATGGNGTDDMSYFEKAAEGWKILAKEAGKKIRSWRTN